MSDKAEVCREKIADGEPFHWSDDLIRAVEKAADTLVDRIEDARAAGLRVSVGTYFPHEGSTKPLPAIICYHTAGLLAARHRAEMEKTSGQSDTSELLTLRADNAIHKDFIATQGQRIKALEAEVAQLQAIVDAIPEPLDTATADQCDYEIGATTIAPRDYHGAPIEENESPNSMITVWSIKPSLDPSFDITVIRNYHHAVDYAKRVVELIMDDPEQEYPVAITISQQTMTLRQYEELYDE